MPVNVEQRLIAKIIKTKDFRSVLKARFSNDLLLTPECKAMFDAIWRYWHSPKHPGKTPSRRWMAEKFKGMFADAKPGSESIEELCEEIREVALAKRLLDLTQSTEELVRDEPYKALEKLRAGVLSMTSMSASSRDVWMSEAHQNLIKEYEMMKKSGGIIGVPWPWKDLNIQTQGMLPEELIIIYGRLKSMKSFIGIEVACHAYHTAHRRVMFYSAELSPAQISKRCAAVLSRVNYQRLKSGKLGTNSETRFKNTLSKLAAEEEENTRGSKRPALLITSDKDDARGIGGVSHIMAKAEEVEPDLIIVDSYYRLRDERSGRNDYDWKVQAGITQDLKHLAQRLRIPVIGITQANRFSSKMDSEEGMEDAAYTDAAGQEADFGLRIVKVSEQPEGTIIKAMIAASRETKSSGFMLLVNPCTLCEWRGFTKTIVEEAAKAPPPKRRRKKTDDETIPARIIAQAQTFPGAQ